MANKIQAIRGMHDILPGQTSQWQFVENVIREVMAAYGYLEIRLPVVEKTELFKRSIGEVTDIVEKEMYTFDDRNGDSLTLRPEGTAGCLRACIEHGLLHNQAHRLWYYGPMFRHERPQKGRYRQFYQLGVETYGLPGPDIDAEIISLVERLWKRLGVSGKMELQLNTLGTPEERQTYRAILVDYLKENIDRLDQDSLRRLDTNPLRILDSKNPEMKSLIENAPELMDSLGEESLNHFNRLKSLLDSLKISYVVNTRLVRGLDYYGKTVFEWVTDELGAQGTVCAGGRYDMLVEQLGSKNGHAVGFAMGIERLVSLLEVADAIPDERPIDAYLICVGEKAISHGLILVEELRDQLPGLKIQMHCGGGSFKSQFKKADKSGAEYALILGEDEIDRTEIGVKALRVQQEQRYIPQNEIVVHLGEALGIQ